METTIWPVFALLEPSLALETLRDQQNKNLEAICISHIKYFEGVTYTKCPISRQPSQNTDPMSIAHCSVSSGKPLPVC
jgi:biotin synthase-related radical SAM superfamily protein